MSQTLSNDITNNAENRGGKRGRNTDNELQVQLEAMKKELAEKDQLLGEKDREVKVFKSQIVKKDREVKVFKSQIVKKDRLLGEKDRLLGEKDREVKVYKARAKKYKNTLMAKSLHAVIVGKGITKIKCKGSRSSNLKPKNHRAATIKKKSFQTPNLIHIIKRLQEETHVNPELEEHGSGLMLKFVEDREQSYHSESEVASYVDLALDDTARICNAIISMIASYLGVSKTANLVVRKEMNIFSNRCEHAVVYDSTSNTPLFCVETKKHFDDEFHRQVKNQSLGQSLDQLKAMQAQGHPFALGALTSFNETYMTSLDPNIDWDTPPTLQSLKEIVARLPGGVLPPNGTPSPLQVEHSTVQIHCTSTGTTGTKKRGSFEAEKNRVIIRSENCIGQKNLVSALVIIMFHALKGFYIPKPLQIYTENQRIVVDCIRMTKGSYTWGKLCTSYKGPYIKAQPSNAALYLIHCIGSGSTSKAYYAVTQNGFGCVVKIYVQSHDEEGQLKTPEDFNRDSKNYIENEIENYTKIYGEELSDYVHMRVLNGFDCVILPFFEPVSVAERCSTEVQNSIQQRLQQFVTNKMAYHECDRKWRHVGRFKQSIYLFDLGDLKHCKTIKAAQTCAGMHYRELTQKSSTT